MKGSMPGVATRLSFAFLATVAIALAGPSARAQVAPNESLVTSQIDLLDFEFSQTRAMITWVDKAGSLWVGNVDRDSGLFVPPSGKGQLVDPSAMTTVDLRVVGNGPEWVTTATGDQIVYTKFLAGKPHTMQYARLATAKPASGGGWSFRYVAAGLRRNAPYGSKDAGDTLPHISYVDPLGNHYWRNLNDGTSETLVAQYPRSFRSLRFVAGARAAVFVAPVDGVSQVFLYGLDTNVAEQLTFDAGQKDLNSIPWMWQAPEFGYDYVFSTIVDDTELRIYRQPASGNDQDPWTPVFSIATPLGGILSSPEPFTHNGKSYVFMSATVPPGTVPSAIFMTNIEASRPLMQQLTPDLPARTRRDPEVFVTSSGPFIYYNRLNSTVNPNCLTCSEGVFRTYTGLPPAL